MAGLSTEERARQLARTFVIVGLWPQGRGVGTMPLPMQHVPCHVPAARSWTWPRLSWALLPLCGQPSLPPDSYYALLLQAGGLMHVALPTWMECTIHKGRTRISSMGLNGTTGRGQATHSRPPPWWFGRQISKCRSRPQEHCPVLFLRRIQSTERRCCTPSPLPQWAARVHKLLTTAESWIAPLTLHGSRNQSKTQGQQQPGEWAGRTPIAEMNSRLRRDDNSQTLLSQPRMSCASLSVNNWKTEHLTLYSTDNLGAAFLRALFIDCVNIPVSWIHHHYYN